MKVNNLIFKILFLYFFIFFVLFSALYLMFPCNLKNYIIVIFFNIFLSTFILCFFLFLIAKNFKIARKFTLTLHCSNVLGNCQKQSINNCKIINCSNTIYWICKNGCIVLYLFGLFVPILTCLIFKEKYIFILCLLSIFSFNIFYIFSEIYFNKILNCSEIEFQVNTTSITKIKRKNIFTNMPISINLILKIFPLIIFTLLIGLNITPVSISSIIFIVFILLIDFLSLLYLAFNFYNNIRELTNSVTNSNFISYNNEFSDLTFKINATKQVYNDYINNLKNIQNKELEKERLASIELLRRSVDAKDSYTRGHSDRVSKYSVLIGENLGLSKSDLETLKIGGLFHDIGKIGITDNILLKTGKLTNTEFEEIKKHPSIGAHILENSSIFENIIPIVLHHHERYDGYGYPSKLKGLNIPFMARIVAVADSFDAMTSKRIYRNSLPIEIVKLEFEKCSGTQFDPKIAKVFLDILNNNFEEIQRIKAL